MSASIENWSSISAKLMPPTSKFSRISHFFAYWHNFYSKKFSSQIWKFERLSPENFAFSFDQGQLLVSRFKGLAEFSRISHFFGYRHNFYTKNFSSQIWKFESLSSENFDFNFDQGQPLVSRFKGLAKFSRISHLFGYRHNFYTKFIWYSTNFFQTNQYSNIDASK
jgi:hypothetical protein